MKKVAITYVHHKYRKIFYKMMSLLKSSFPLHGKCQNRSVQKNVFEKLICESIPVLNAA